MSWNTQIIDIDFHEIRNVDNELLNPPAPVIIHDNCWLCSGVKIYKGVEIYQGCVIAGDASICKSVNEPKWFIPSAIASVVVVFIVCSIIDLLRQKLLSGVKEKVISWIDSRYSLINH